MHRLLLLPIFAFFVPVLFGQKVPPEHIYHRVYAVVPIIGSGTVADPKRPMFIPSPAEALAVKPVAVTGVGAGIGAAAQTSIPRPAILSYHMELSDDGKFALVEFVGATPADLKFIALSTATGVTAFERGNVTKAQVQAAFQKYKKNFDADRFLGGSL